MGRDEQMETKRFGTEQGDLQEAAALLRAGEAVAFPTETVYGLGANALDANAVDKIFRAKGRPSDNPLIVHIAHRKEVDKLAQVVPPLAERAMAHFWPGPLTVILPCTAIVPMNVTAGLDTVGIRMPDHVIAQQLIDAAGVPIAAPSANSSGRPSPTTAAHVLEDLTGKIAGVVDGGASGVGVESTVVDFTGPVPMILRPGGVTREMLEEVLGDVRIDPSLEQGVGQPKSPGMKYTHYAPHGEMSLVDGPQAVAVMQGLVHKAHESGRKVGVLTTEEHEG
jgi:L-threonylcarbamoyladenylate synthase